MKKIYILAFSLVASLSFAQTPIISGIMDGDCPGGNPKVLEIYANGTVNFANYSIENQTNASTTWGQTLSLASLGTVTNAFVYIVSPDTASSFSSEFAAIPSSSVLVTGTGETDPQPLSVNGDDRIRLINNNSTVIDQFGQEGTDGTGASWEYTDSWARRVNNTGPDGSAFNTANWTYGGVAALDGLGSCQGGAAYSTIVPFGQYVAPTANTKDNSISGLKMFPNPLSGNVLNITSNNNDVKAVTIFDVLGKQVINAKTVNNTVNVSGLTSGVYMVKITEAGKTSTRKLVIK